jgi:hypothetical protein
MWRQYVETVRSCLVRSRSGAPKLRSSVRGGKHLGVYWGYGSKVLIVCLSSGPAQPHLR